jgi:hypothetical protein
MYTIIDGATPSVLLIEKLYEVKPLISSRGEGQVNCTKGILNTQYYPVLIVSNPFWAAHYPVRLASRQLGAEIDCTQLLTLITG